MGRVDGQGKCESCQADFPYYLIHNGFNDSWYAYCDRCGKTALFSFWNKTVAERIKNLKLGSLQQGQISPSFELQIPPCDCGGHFTAKATPRCPRCNHVLSAEEAADWIEANALGTVKGWRWQRSWNGEYCVVIEGREVSDSVVD
jgi:hypothetical protein